jgi:hypothetical protein
MALELEAEVGIGGPGFMVTFNRTTSLPTTSSDFQRSLRYPVFAENVTTIPQVHQHYPPTIPELAFTLLLALLLAIQEPANELSDCLTSPCLLPRSSSLTTG